MKSRGWKGFEKLKVSLESTIGAALPLAKMFFYCHVYFQVVKSCSCLGGWEESFGESRQSDSVAGEQTVEDERLVYLKQRGFGLKSVNYLLGQWTANKRPLGPETGTWQRFWNRKRRDPLELVKSPRPCRQAWERWYSIKVTWTLVKPGPETNLRPQVQEAKLHLQVELILTAMC